MGVHSRLAHEATRSDGMEFEREFRPPIRHDEFECRTMHTRHVTAESHAHDIEYIRVRVCASVVVILADRWSFDVESSQFQAGEAPSTFDAPSETEGTIHRFRFGQKSALASIHMLVEWMAPMQLHVHRLLCCGRALFVSCRRVRESTGAAKASACVVACCAWLCVGTDVNASMWPRVGSQCPHCCDRSIDCRLQIPSLSPSADRSCVHSTTCTHCAAHLSELASTPHDRNDSSQLRTSPRRAAIRHALSSHIAPCRPLR
jgi:hypothetical protein